MRFVCQFLVLCITLQARPCLRFSLSVFAWNSIVGDHFVACAQLLFEKEKMVFSHRNLSFLGMAVRSWGGRIVDSDAGVISFYLLMVKCYFFLDWWRCI